MILQVLAVYDAKARSYAKPFFVAHIDVGIRAFRTHANTPGNEMYENPEDFTLFHLGTWSDDTGCMLQVGELRQVAFAANVKEYREVSDVQRKVA